MPGILHQTLIAAAMAAGLQAGEAGGDGLRAWIEPVSEGQTVEFRSYVSATAPGIVHYQLRVERIGAAGRSSTAQGGRVTVTGDGAPTPLSVTAINLTSGDAYSVELIAETPDGRRAVATLSR